MGPISPTDWGILVTPSLVQRCVLRFSALYALQNKSRSSLLDSFVRFERDLEETEYTNRAFKHYCNITGVIKQFITSDTP